MNKLLRSIPSFQITLRPALVLSLLILKNLSLLRLLPYLSLLEQMLLVMSRSGIRVAWHRSHGCLKLRLNICHDITCFFLCLHLRHPKWGFFAPLAKAIVSWTLLIFKKFSTRSPTMTRYEKFQPSCQDKALEGYS